MPTPTSSTSHVYIDPQLDVGTLTSQAIQDRLTQADAALVQRQTNIAAEQTRATLAEAAELARAAAAEAALTAAVATEAAARTASVAVEAAARVADDGTELVARINADTAVNARIDMMSAVASTSGGTASTTLARLVEALAISSIGGNGTLTTVTTAVSHGLTAGDFLKISGTTNYNVSTGAISILSANQFTYLSAVNAATETTGFACHIAVFVASTTGFVANQRITITNDVGDLHGTTVSGTPGGSVIQLAAAVPTSWTTTSKASIGAWVSTTLEEVALARASMPGNGLNLATLLRYGLGYRCAPDAFAGANDAAKIAAAWTAASSGAGELLLTRDYVLDTTDQLVLTGSKVKISSQRGGRIIVASTSTVTRPFIIRTATDIDLSDLQLLCQRTGPTAGLCIENSSRIRVQGMRILSFPVYGICISQNTTPVLSSSGISFTASTKTMAGVAGDFASLPPGTIFVLQVSSYNNGMHTVATRAGDSSSITVLETVTDEAAGQPVTFQIATACDDITLEGNTIEDATVIGAEGFPKVLSQNIFVVYNTFKRCGLLPGNVVAAGGGAIKAGTMTRNAIISHNHIHDGGTGIAVGMWEATEIDHNVVQDCYGFGIAITASNHRLFGNGYAGVPSFSMLKGKDNLLVYTPNFAGIGNAGININGLKTDTGPIDIEGNTLNGWLTGIAMTNSLQALRLIRIRNNTLVDGQVSVTQLSADGTSAIGSNLLTGVVATAGGPPFGWAIGALIENATALPPGTTIVDIANGGATLTLSANATASGVNVSITNISGDVATRATLVNGSNVLSSVVSIEGWNVGDIIDAPGVPAGTTITAGASSASTFTLSANAIAAGLATFTSGLPVGLTFANNDLTATIYTVTGTTTNGNATVASVSAADIAKLRVGMFVRGTGITPGTVINSIGASSFVLSAVATGSGTVTITAVRPRKINLWSTNLRALRNTIRGFSAYALDVKGGGIINGNEFIDIDPEGITNRGAIFLRDALAYTATNNTYDNGTYGAIEYGINNTASTLLREENNIPVQSSIRAVLTPTAGFGAYSQNAGVTHAGRRVFYAAAPPIAADGTFAVGSFAFSTAPAAAGILGWVCTTAGSPGTWKPVSIHSILVGTATWDPASLTTGSSEVKAVTVTGAVVGNAVAVGFTTLPNTKWQLSGNVTAADTVSVTITNNTGGTVDLGSGTVTAIVIQT